MSEPSPDTPEPLPTGPPWSGRGLRLPAPPTAEVAQRAVDAERNISGVELDYSPASLIRVDEVLDSFREPGSVSVAVAVAVSVAVAVAETILAFGCYVG